MTKSKFHVCVSTKTLVHEIKLTICVKINGVKHKYENVSTYLKFLLNDDEEMDHIRDWVRSFTYGYDTLEVLDEVFYKLSKLS